MTEKVEIVDWEAQGKDALRRVFNNLHEPSMRLKLASDHYLHSYQGDNLPGVSSSLDAQIRSTENYRRNPSGDPIITHMVDSAATLVREVESHLATIRPLADATSARSLESVSENAEALLKRLLVAKEPGQFDREAQELEKAIKGAVDNVRKGATSGQSAAHVVTKLSEGADYGFENWWRANYQKGYGQTMSAHGLSLRSFAETVRSREQVYQARTGSVLFDVPENTADPVIRFISDFRSDKFPQKTS